MGKVFEKIVAAVLSLYQFEFRPGHSSSDLFLLSQEWVESLGEGLDTLVVAINTVGAFGPGWTLSWWR